MLTEPGTHQVKDSFEANRRDFRIEMVTSNVPLCLFKTVQIVIGGIVVAFLGFPSWRTFKGQKGLV